MNVVEEFVIEHPPLHLPTVRGVIDRRMLVNFRVQPKVLARFLPAPFRPKLLYGFGMAGICLLRLRELRPAGLPAFLGVGSENAAHRIAVEWDDRGVRREGVFIPRRDTNAWFNRLAGGRIFPGAHHAAEFRVWETGCRYKLEMRSDDGEAFIRVLAHVSDALPAGSAFQSLADASAFFQSGALGWSARTAASEFDGLELHCPGWRMEPLAVDKVESSFFANRAVFPPGTVEFDSAFLMRGLDHEWLSRGRLKVGNTL